MSIERHGALRPILALSVVLGLCACAVSAAPPETAAAFPARPAAGPSAVTSASRPGPVDARATPETKALFANLRAVARRHVLFGHQDDLAYGVSWRNQPGRSDVKETAGAYPAVYGWDAGHIELGAGANLDGNDFGDVRGWIEEGYGRGGVVTLSWHLDNPVSGGSAWDTTSAVAAVLPGGARHACYRHWLDRLAAFVTGPRGPAGEPVPIIFRPYHEMHGSWFWWGGRHASPEQYRQLWRFTVSYLRDTVGVHNLLYAYAPDAVDSRADYLERYPGDDWVDVLGVDDYQSVSRPASRATFVRRLRDLVELAEARGKIPALTETGANAIPDPHWWTGTLLAGLQSDSVAGRIAWLLVWRNANAATDRPNHFFAPYPGQASAGDFVEFERDPLILFGDSLPDLYHRGSSSGSPQSAERTGGGRAPEPAGRAPGVAPVGDGRAAVGARRGSEARVDSILARMTLEEKVGQMTQIVVGILAAPGPQEPGKLRLDPHKLREALVEKHVGAILNVDAAALSLEGWHELLRQIQDVAVKETRLHIPVIYGIDAVHGVNYTRGATIFPQNIGLAATFDRELARRQGEVTGTELLATGIPWNFAPVLDVGRQPLFPRFYETLGEDPTLGAELGRELVLGMQGSGGVAATAKHYLGYSGPRTGRDRTPADLTERVVREEYLPPFAAAVRAGARTVIVNSGDIDGVPLHASRHWLSDVLRGELGFQGVIDTDYQDIIFLHTRHQVAATLREATRLAIDAGIDMSMTPSDYDFEDELIALVRDGTITESRVDASVRRILTLKAELGLLDRPYPDTARVRDFAAPASREAARRAARESMTLLQNDSLLPLRPDMRVLVTGPAAASLTALNGGWTYTWQGTDATQFPAGAPTILDAIRRHAARVTYVPGSGFDSAGDVLSAARAAREADVAVVVIGEDAYAEWVGDIRDLTLPEPQLRLVEAVQATGTPTVLVLVEGRPRVISRVADGARAILMAYQPGMEGAGAIADVLFGTVNPSGKLPFTYPRQPDALDTYDHRLTEESGTDFARGPGGFDPQFEFGRGLSYTTFSYAGLALGRDTLRPGESQTIEVTVRTTGNREGTETVLLFSHQHYASIAPPLKRLRDFQRVTLVPGEARTVRFTLPAEALSFVGHDGRRVLEPGAFDVLVGGLRATFQLGLPAIPAAPLPPPAAGGTP